MSNFDTAVFTDIEEIGFRLKALRLRDRASVNGICQDVMTHVAYTSIEDGRGSVNVLAQVASLLNTHLQIKLFKDDNEVWHSTDLLALRDALADYRADNDISRSHVARRMGVPYASVNVFESAVSPRIRSFSRLIEAMELRAEFTLYEKVEDADVAVIPATFLERQKLKKLQEDFKNSLAKDMSEVKVDTRLGDQIKALREKLGYSKAQVSRLSGVKDASMAKVEMSNTRLTTAAKVVESLGYDLRVVVGSETIDVADFPQYLDQVRVAKGYTPSEFAREIGTTYRAVKIFPESQVSMSTLNRYIDGLKLNVRYKLVKKSSK